MTAAFKRKSVSESVIEYIQSEIKKGNLTPGDKLPPEQVLSEELQISRASLREALQKLEVTGVIEIKHGKGSFISSNPSVKALKNLIPPLLLSINQGVIKLLEARRFVEIGTARLAAKNASPEQKEQLEDCIFRMEEAVAGEDFEAFQQADLEFHLTIAESSGNEVLARILDALRDLMVEQLNVILQVPGRIDSSLKYHRKVYKAIINGNGEKAGRAIDRHIRNAEEDFKKSEEAKIEDTEQNLEVHDLDRQNSS